MKREDCNFAVIAPLLKPSARRVVPSRNLLAAKTAVLSGSRRSSWKWRMADGASLLRNPIEFQMTTPEPNENVPPPSPPRDPTEPAQERRRVQFSPRVEASPLPGKTATEPCALPTLSALPALFPHMHVGEAFSSTCRSVPGAWSLTPDVRKRQSGGQRKRVLSDRPLQVHSAQKVLRPNVDPRHEDRTKWSG